MTKKIIIIGGNGQIGWDLQRTVSSLGNVIVLNRNSSQYAIDLGNVDSIYSALNKIKPNIIINASAYTAVDKAESEPGIAHDINTKAVSFLAEQANKLNALLVHYSTDYVFNGQATRPYTEDDNPEPLNVYGQTKLEGDLAIKAIAKNYLIFRTSWVYTNRANNFMLTMLKLARKHNELSIINDQFSSPTWSRVIADVSAKAIYRKYQLKNNIDNGLYNLSNNGETSWYGFAKKIFEYTGLMNTIKVKPIASVDYPTAAQRPKYTVLSKNKIERTFSIVLPAWEDSLRLCLGEYQSPK